MRRSIPFETKAMANYRSTMTRSSEGALDRAIRRVGRQQEAARREREAQEDLNSHLMETGGIFGTTLLTTLAQVRGWLPSTVPGTPIPFSLAAGILTGLGAAYVRDDATSNALWTITKGLAGQYGTVSGSMLAGGIDLRSGTGARIGAARAPAQVGCGAVGCGAIPMMNSAMPGFVPPGYTPYAGVPMQPPMATTGVPLDMNAEVDAIMRKYRWIP